MTEALIAFVLAAGIIGVVVIVLATRRAKKRRGHNPDDIYPLW